MSLKEVFAQQLNKCFPHTYPKRVLVALSGGVDSMCLTHLLHDYRTKHHKSFEIHALTIDHGYRSDSAQEALDVGVLVKKWGVKHHIKKLTYDRELSTITNFEEAARALRYKAFQEKCYELDVDGILVAHTLDDQLETFLQRLQMNSTLYGLSGLRRVSPFPLPPIAPIEVLSPLKVYRPLLSSTKAEIIDLCRADDVGWFEDITNADPSLTKRNWLRYLIHDYLPSHPSEETKILSVQEQCISISRVHQAREYLEARVWRFDKYIKEHCSYQFDEQLGIILFAMMPEVWQSIDYAVAGRWLYNAIYPLSSSKHYHWSYAKIERQAMPRIDDFMSSNKECKLTLTYLNVKIDLRKLKDGSVSVKLSRQSLPRDQQLKNHFSIALKNELSPWVLFSNTWWLRLSDSLRRKVTIVPYMPSMRKELLETFPKTPKFIAEVPVVKDSSSGQILALPTLGACQLELQAEWYIKRSP